LYEERMSSLGRSLRLGKRWSPKACSGVLYTSRRYESDNMPWPFDKYKRPAAAKYWLSKFPKTTGDQDEYPEEYVYLDELENRIEGFHEKFRNSDNFNRIYNEMGWEDHEQVTKAYGVSSGGAGERDGYGRGKKVNPANYVSPWFHTVGRITTPAVQHMSAAQVRHDSTLGSIMQLPPEEPSAMKFWNAYQVGGCVGLIFLSKEIFVVGHDFWHALLIWFGFSFITAVCVDWWLWWYALRGQEFYDLKFFPLNNKVEAIYNMLAEMETKGAEKNIVLASQIYGDQLANRLAKHKMLAEKVRLAYEIQDKLQSQAANEALEVKEAEAKWKVDATSAT